MDLASLLDHEEQCGSRTEPCENCGCNVVIKAFPDHLQMCFNDENQEEVKKNPLKRKNNLQHHGKKRGKK
jgi:hypothetical protein